MKPSILYVGIVLVAVFFASSPLYAASVTPEDIAGSYVLSRVNGAPFMGEQPAELRVGPGQAMAGRICNTFRGQYTLENDVLHMADFMTTRMACPGELGLAENAFLRGLRAGFGVLVYGDTLELRRDDQIYIYTRSTDSKPEVPAESSSPEDAPVSAGTVRESDLVGQSFVLRRVDGEDFRPEMGRQPSIAFAADMRVSGSACNQFSGPGTLENGVLTMESAASTMMLCVDETLSGFERDFYQMLREGARVSLDGDVLTLTGTVNGDTRVFEYEHD